MPKHQNEATKTRYDKINALFRRKLIPTALFPKEMIELHEVRTRRRADAVHFAGYADDVETPQDCWERAGARIRRLDPERRRTRALLRQLTATR